MRGNREKLFSSRFSCNGLHIYFLAEIYRLANQIYTKHWTANIESQLSIAVAYERTISCYYVGNLIYQIRDPVLFRDKRINSLFYLRRFYRKSNDIFFWNSYQRREIKHCFLCPARQCAQMCVQYISGQLQTVKCTFIHVKVPIQCNRKLKYLVQVLFIIL